MTGKADFTQEEWQEILEAPTSAGLIVVTAQSGGTFRESIAMGRAYVEARQQHGESDRRGETGTRPHALPLSRGAQATRAAAPA